MNFSSTGHNWKTKQQRLRSHACSVRTFILFTNNDYMLDTQWTVLFTAQPQGIGAFVLRNRNTNSHFAMACRCIDLYCLFNIAIWYSVFYIYPHWLLFIFLNLCEFASMLWRGSMGGAVGGSFFSARKEVCITSNKIHILSNSIRSHRLNMIPHARALPCHHKMNNLSVYQKNLTNNRNKMAFYRGI